jgi:anoctamin-10
MKELERDELELFDDYLEMIMTFGYITLFAAAFPLGATLTCIFIYIEVRSDIFKLEKCARRPMSKKTHDIGTWMFALNTLTYVSIFTNIMLTCFASQQIDTLLPFLKDYKDFSKTSILTVVSIEHVVIVLVLLFKWLYDREPLWL